jgi:hypothetical protein
MMNINFDPAGRQGSKGIFAQVLTVIAGVIALGAALMFSLAFFSIVAVAGLILWLYLWWKTRELRRLMREQAARQMNGQSSDTQAFGPDSGGEVIEGEAVRVVDERNRLSE